MEDQYRREESHAFGDDALGLRVYTSRLLGREPSLVLHGGGNTSVKVREPNFFGEMEDVLYVKGSGWDLKSIEREGFAPVAMSDLLKLAELPTLSDTDMVRIQKGAMTDVSRPNPSVETILHAVIPFAFVDHTHADTVVTITNTSDGPKRIVELYGDRVLVIPYVMPGFKLARAIYEAIDGVDFTRIEGMILLNHGVFTFGDTAEESYSRMIRLVSEAEDYLELKNAPNGMARGEAQRDLIRLADTRQAVSHAFKAPIIARLSTTPEAVGYSSLEGIQDVATRGTVTPDHVIRTKPKPMFVGVDPKADIKAFEADYQAYFERNNPGGLTCLDSAPRWGLWPGHGALAFGRTLKEAAIIEDIIRHTMQAVQWGEALGGWRPLEEADLFEMEYWELEQAKLKKLKSRPSLAGRIAFVSGGASGIGRAVVLALLEAGAAVVSVDCDPSIESVSLAPTFVGVVGDVTSTRDVDAAIETAVERFGGLDILVSNAGSFPPSITIEECDDDLWSKTLELNLSSHQKVLRAATPFLRRGWEPSVLIIGSKNVPAPGPGVSPYSVAKAGLTQLARVAALELGVHGIRVNTIHPNAVFDTGIWNDETVAKRAANYGITSAEYRKRNVLGVEITSHDVASMIVALLGEGFLRTTGAQIPIDGGNERVI
jgi:rhamnose utilization protein RhaD (predicted bifunctional aldolase and dehydrogenase)/NAD(P)-dependent dehydrogenase (short-subunit alcohol dehydrogenase family)